MPDEKIKPTDKPSESAHPTPAEAPTKDAVISGQSNQKNWQQMDEQHKKTLEESHTAIGVPHDKRPKVKSKLEIVDDQTTQASNNNNNSSNSKNSNNVIDNIGKSLDAAGKQINAVGEEIVKDIKLAGDSIGMVECLAVEMPVSTELGHLLRPHYGREDQFISYPDCRSAAIEFRQVSQYVGHADNQIDPTLIAAVIRLEQKWLVQMKDTGLDNYIKDHPDGGVAGKNHSIGPAQMRMSTIEQLVKDYPYELSRFSHDPLKHALDVKNAPYFVAAYFACIIDHIVDKHHQRPDFVPAPTWNKVCRLWEKGERNNALICAYNDNPGQLGMVTEQMKIIKDKGLH